jgi:hypothetical protein
VQQEINERLGFEDGKLDLHGAGFTVRYR